MTELLRRYATAQHKQRHTELEQLAMPFAAGDCHATYKQIRIWKTTVLSLFQNGIMLPLWYSE